MKQQKSILLVIDRLDYETGSSPRHAIQRHSGGGKCLRPFFHGQIVSRDDKRRGICCEDRDVNARGTNNPSKSSMYKYRREEVLENFYSTQPTFSTNPFDQPFRPPFSTSLFAQRFRPTFSTVLLDQPFRPTFSTNKMRFILAIAAVLSALTMTNATKVSCEAGLSDTDICEKTYCLCDGEILTCQAGTTCAQTCVCAA